MVTTKLPETFYFKSGKKAVILLHAYTGSPNDMRMLARALENHGYTVYAPMFSGHGTLNPEDILAAGPDVWWQDTLQALAFMKSEGHEQVAIFGLSMGGIFTMEAITHNPEFILAGGTICSPVVPEKEHQILPNFLKYVKTVLTYAKVSEAEIIEKLSEIKPKISQQLSEIELFSAKVSNELAQIEQPVFLAQAGKDDMIDPQSVYLTAARLTNTTGQIYWYPESGHVMTVGRDHQQLEQDVLTFLNTLSWNEEKI